MKKLALLFIRLSGLAVCAHLCYQIMDSIEHSLKSSRKLGLLKKDDKSHFLFILNGMQRRPTLKFIK